MSRARSRVRSMVAPSVLVTFAIVAGSSGCAIKTLENGIQIETLQAFATSTPSVKSAVTDWDGRAIEVENVNGDVEVIGEAGRTKVEASATFFARAKTEQDAKDAMGQIEGAFAVEERTNNTYVHCAQASKDFGSAPVGTTGCRITVRVPAGTTDKGVPFKVRAGNGSLKVTGLTAAAGQQMLILANNGNATLSGITGGVKVQADLGDVDLSVAPTLGSVIAVDIGEGTSGLGDVTLRLPATFASDVVSLTVPAGDKVDIVAFPDVVSGQPRGTQGSGAASIAATVHGSGDITLAKQ